MILIPFLGSKKVERQKWVFDISIRMFSDVLSEGRLRRFAFYQNVNSTWYFFYRIVRERSSTKSL